MQEGGGLLASLTEVLLRLVLGAKAPLGPLDEKGKEYQPSGAGGTRSRYIGDIEKR